MTLVFIGRYFVRIRTPNFRRRSAQKGVSGELDTTLGGAEFYLALPGKMRWLADVCMSWKSLGQGLHQWNESLSSTPSGTRLSVLVFGLLLHTQVLIYGRCIRIVPQTANQNPGIPKGGLVMGLHSYLPPAPLVTLVFLPGFPHLFYGVWSCL